MLLIAVGLLVAELVAARLWGYLDTDRSRPVSSGPLPPQMTEAQKQPAVDLVRASGIVERINGNQPW